MTQPTGRPRGRPKTKEYVTLMARIPQDLADRVQRYARVHQQPISVVLRDGLTLLLDGEEERYRPFLPDRNTVSDILSDMLQSTPEPAMLPDTNTASSIMSDAKEDQPARQPALLSDTNVQTFDTTKYTLGKLCPRRHDYHGTGQSLRRLPKFVCLACDAERARERRQGQRADTAP